MREFKVGNVLWAIDDTLFDNLVKNYKNNIKLGNLNPDYVYDLHESTIATSLDNAFIDAIDQTVEKVITVDDKFIDTYFKNFAVDFSTVGDGEGVTEAIPNIIYEACFVDKFKEDFYK